MPINTQVALKTDYVEKEGPVLSLRKKTQWKQNCLDYTEVSVQPTGSGFLLLELRHNNWGGGGRKADWYSLYCNTLITVDIYFVMWLQGIQSVHLDIGLANTAWTHLCTKCISTKIDTFVKTYWSVCVLRDT